MLRTVQCIYISANLFQCYQKDQYTLCNHSRSCCSCPVSCICTVPDLSHHFNPLVSFPAHSPLCSVFVQCIPCFTCSWYMLRFSGGTTCVTRSRPEGVHCLLLRTRALTESGTCHLLQVSSRKQSF